MKIRHDQNPFKWIRRCVSKVNNITIIKFGSFENYVQLYSTKNQDIN
jgi:hypothetical protein